MRCLHLLVFQSSQLLLLFGCNLSNVCKWAHRTIYYDLNRMTQIEEFYINTHTHTLKKTDETSCCLPIALESIVCTVFKRECYTHPQWKWQMVKENEAKGKNVRVQRITNETNDHNTQRTATIRMLSKKTRMKESK